MTSRLATNGSTNSKNRDVVFASHSWKHPFGPPWFLCLRDTDAVQMLRRANRSWLHALPACRKKSETAPVPPPLRCVCARTRISNMCASTGADSPAGHTVPDTPPVPNHPSKRYIRRVEQKVNIERDKKQTMYNAGFRYIRCVTPTVISQIPTNSKYQT
jgi:hypothetical protein